MSQTLPPYRSEAFAEDFSDDPAYQVEPARTRAAGVVWVGAATTLGAAVLALIAWLGTGGQSA